MSKAASEQKSIRTSRQSRTGQLTIVVLVLIIGQTSLSIVETLSVRSQQQKIRYHDLELIRSLSRIRAEYALQFMSLQRITMLAQMDSNVDPKLWEQALEEFQTQRQRIAQSVSETGDNIERSEKIWPEYEPFTGHLGLISRNLNRLDSDVLTIARLAEEGRQSDIEKMTAATSANAEETRKRIDVLWQNVQSSVTSTTHVTEQHARILLFGWLALICLLGLAVGGLRYAELSRNSTVGTRVSLSGFKQVPAS